MADSRFRSIEIFGILLIIWGVISLLFSGLNYLVCGAYSGYNKLPPSLPFELLCGAILISSGIGLRKQKSWARLLTIFFVVPLFIIVIPYIQFKYLAFFWNRGYTNSKQQLGLAIEIIRIIFGTSLLYYFTRSKVKEQFN